MPISDQLPIKVSHPDKIFWPDEGYSKLDLLRVYRSGLGVESQGKSARGKPPARKSTALRDCQCRRVVEDYRRCGNGAPSVAPEPHLNFSRADFVKR
jgi:hypothetical protein